MHTAKQNCRNNSLIGYYICKDLKLHGHAVDAIIVTEVLFCYSSHIIFHVSHHLYKFKVAVNKWLKFVYNLQLHNFIYQEIPYIFDNKGIFASIN